jgi:hypothetical protein
MTTFFCHCVLCSVTSAISFLAACGGSSANSPTSSQTAAGSGGSAQSFAGSSGKSAAASGASVGTSAVLDLGGAAGAEDGAFLPATIDYVDVNPDASEDVTVLAASMQLQGAHPTMLMKVQNVSQVAPGHSGVIPTACQILFAINLYAADGSPAGAATGYVRAALFVNSSDIGPCLRLGDVGYVAADLAPSDGDFSMVTRAEYRGQVVEPAANLAFFSGLKLSPLSAMNGQVGGTLTNIGSTPFPNPAMQYFAVNASGTPVAYDSVVNQAALDAGATWSFVLPNTASIDRYALFAEHRLDL